MTARLKDYARIGASLRRVRVADRPLEGGGKKVWHQGEQGAEVISFVDAGGNVTRQEAWVVGQVVVWQADGPLATGSQQLESSGGDVFAPDAQVSVPAVLNAVSMLEGFAGQDNYLAHLRAVLRIAAERLPSQGLDADDAAALRRVTADLPVVTPDELERVASRGNPWPWIAIAVALLVALVVLVLRR